MEGRESNCYQWLSYAFLDPGSNASFCTDKLMTELNLCGRTVNITTTTMGEQRVVRRNVVTDLEVIGLNDNDFIKLTEVFSQRAIPVSKDHIPQQEEVDQWPHLKGVQVPCINAEIGLLIGTNVPKALEPQGIIHNVNEGSYAVRTALGWMVNGPLREGNCNLTKERVIQVYSNRISVSRLEDLWSQQFKYDFPEQEEKI